MLSDGNTTIELFSWPTWAGSVLYAMGLITALMTAFYMTRLYIGTFFGEFKGWKIVKVEDAAKNELWNSLSPDGQVVAMFWAIDEEDLGKIAARADSMAHSTFGKKLDLKKVKDAEHRGMSTVARADAAARVDLAECGPGPRDSPRRRHSRSAESS